MKENINHPPDAPNPDDYIFEDHMTLLNLAPVENLSQEQIEKIERLLWNVNSTTNQPFCITYKRDNESKNP
jgi:hypothetical protein